MGDQISAIRLLQFSIILSKPLAYFYRDARAQFLGQSLLSLPTNTSTTDEEAAIYKWGLTISNIRDRQFRDNLIKLAKRHNQIITENSPPCITEAKRRN